MTPIARALSRAAAGKTLDLDEAAALLAARGPDLDALLELAAKTRDAGLELAGRPGAITFSKKVFIPLTQLCRDSCGYCTFAHPPLPGHRAFLTMDEVLDIARAGVEAGCQEALFTLGDKPERKWDVARDELAAMGYQTTIDYLVDA